MVFIFIFKTVSQVIHTGLILYTREWPWTPEPPTSLLKSATIAGMHHEVYEVMGPKSRASCMISKHSTGWTTFLVIVTMFDCEKVILVLHCMTYLISSIGNNCFCYLLLWCKLPQLLEQQFIVLTSLKFDHYSEGATHRAYALLHKATGTMQPRPEVLILKHLVTWATFGVSSVLRFWKMLSVGTLVTFHYTLILKCTPQAHILNSTGDTILGYFWKL